MRTRNGARPENGERIRPKAAANIRAVRAAARAGRYQAFPSAVRSAPPGAQPIQLPPIPPPVQSDELERIFEIEDRIERAISLARYRGREEGWSSDVQVFNAAVSQLDKQWFRWNSAHPEVCFSIAWMGFRRDWHRLRMHFLHLPDFRQPSETFPYPKGSFESTLRAWYERELKWTREWRSCEFELAIFEAGGGRVYH